MECQRCRAATSEASRFCHICGNDLRSADGERRQSFAARPDEAVASFALVSTIMPRSSGQRPQTYKLALIISLSAALLAAIFGALPIALLIAAFAIPIVYIVYIYDVNLWEDEPVTVTVAAFVVTGILAVLFTLLWTRVFPLQPTLGSMFGGTTGPQVRDLLVLVVLVPVVSEILKQLGPLFLASRPKFDDLMDGLTFGVISGVAFSAFETIVLHGDLITAGPQGTTNSGLWMAIVFTEGFVKPLIYGTATGLACAEFSGLGKGYDGFTPRYFAALGLAVVANMLYQAGVFLLGFVGTQPLGQILGVIWGLMILGLLILRLRNVLHLGLLESALERAARDGGVGAHGELGFCPQCEMPLLVDAGFCAACGTSLRAKGQGVHVHAEAASGPVETTTGDQA
jgi:RsiW-degrading membrane proteinase PrsW (M82 family)